jgi:hypothetical protein
LSGTFQLVVGDAVTSSLNFNSGPREVKAALEALASVDLVDVAASGNALTGITYSITFQAPAGNVPTIVVNTTGLQGPTPGSAVSTFLDGSTALFMDPIPGDLLTVRPC